MIVNPKNQIALTKVHDALCYIHIYYYCVLLFNSFRKRIVLVNSNIK